MSNRDVFLNMYRDIYQHGQRINPRGLECIEKVDYKFTLDMNYSPLTSFKSRNLNLNYAKREFLWYLGADKYDTSIEQYAKMWTKIRQPDGSYYSNYGQYIFAQPYPGGKSQFWFVVDELRRDKDSRRASIVLLQPHHLFSDNSDVVCTYAINFRIRNNQLHMTVMMRSNDAVFGTTNDVFCFAMLYRLVYAQLADELDINIGSYTHFVNSIHIYERHYEMVRNIIQDGRCCYQEIDIPWPSVTEAHDLVVTQGQTSQGEFASWLKQVD